MIDLEKLRIDPMKLDNERLDHRLKELEVGVKKVDTWLKRFGIAGACLGLIVTAGTILTGYKTYQEGKRVNVALTVSDQLLPRGRVLVNAELKNDSRRQVQLAMIGVRLWKAAWTNGTEIATRPDLLQFSEIRVAECPDNVCDD